MSLKHTSMIASVIVALAFFLRLFAAADIPFFIDDDTDWILMANFLSFDFKSPSLLPFGTGHGPLTVYLVKFSGMMFGENAFGWRVFSIFFGTLLVVIIYLITKEGLGSRVAKFAAYLSSVNILFIFMSNYASANIISLFLFYTSLLFLLCALKRENNFYMLLAGVSMGFGLLNKEDIAVLFIVFLVFITCIKKYRFWLKKKTYYISICISLIIGSPYLRWLFTHNFYFYQPAVEQGGRWIHFFNFPSAISYLFLGLPGSLFDKEYALGFYFIGPWIGTICVISIIYSLRYLRNNFICLMHIIFWTVFLCEVVFFKGIPRQFIIIIVPALIVTAFVFDKLWQKNKLCKFCILSILAYFFISALLFTFNSERYYWLHSQHNLWFSNGKSIQINLNDLAQKFIRYAQPFNPTLIVFPEPELDSVNNFVNAYSKIKTIGTNLENRFLPYTGKDFERVVIFSVLNDDLKRYEDWAKRNSLSLLREEKKIHLAGKHRATLKILLLSSANNYLSAQEIDSFLTLTMPYDWKDFKIFHMIK